jgi:hypothetical protein
MLVGKSAVADAIDLRGTVPVIGIPNGSRFGETVALKYSRPKTSVAARPKWPI